MLSAFSLTAYSQFPVLPDAYKAAPQNYIQLSTQEEVDNFPNEFAGIKDLEYSLLIEGKDISNLDSLYILNSIEGDLFIGHVALFPPPLNCNPVLENIDGLENLEWVSGELYIAGNPKLTSIEGLSNLNSLSLESITIVYNPNLDDCSISNFCNFKEFLPDDLHISDNGIGCSSKEEMDCGLKEEYVSDDTPYFFIYSNTEDGHLYVSSNDLEGNRVHIYNYLGQLMLPNVGPMIDITDFPAGNYIVEVVTKEGAFRETVGINI